MRIRWAAAGCIVLAVGCARSARLEHRVDAGGIRKSVAALRGLPERRPTPVTVVDDRTFLEMLAERSAPLERDANSSRLAEAAASVASEEQSLEQAETLGFYDASQHSIFIRNRPAQERDALPLSWVIVHELTHALQHQHFRIRDVASLPTVDEKLAYMALVEGDAMVTMIAHGAQENFVPIRRALVLTVRNMERGEAESLERFGAPPERADHVSPMVRARMEFPYEEGTRFVSAIHRTGGFALVNRMYERPPRTTEQVLHPEKYVSGEGAVEIEEPRAPSGYTPASTGRMGELGVYAMLAACVDEDSARRAAAGWGGDAFLLSTSPRGETSVAWSTAWDTPADAGEFAGAVRRCSDAQATGSVHHDGYRVSVVTGERPPDVAAYHRHLVGLRAWRAPPAPPLPVTAVTPLPPMPEIPKASLTADRYESPRLDLALPVPPGFKASLSDGALVLEADESLLEVSFSPAVVTTESTAKVYRDFIDMVGIRSGALAVVSNDRMETPVGAGLERTWAVPGTNARLQVLVLPVCGGNGAAIFKRVWADAHQGRLLDWVVQSARRLRGGTPPVCAELW